jgi:mitotic spindle assembly checkpoint protein MAD2
MASICLVCALPLSLTKSIVANSPEVSNDDQVKNYIKKIMSQLNKWMVNGKISKLVVVITSKDTGEHIERWQFDVQIFNKSSKSRSTNQVVNQENTAPR